MRVTATPITSRIGAVVFAAPDIDMDIFSSSVRRIGPLAGKITVIAATNDRALALSGQMAGGMTRVGAAEKARHRKARRPRGRCVPRGLGPDQPRPVPVERRRAAGDPPLDRYRGSEMNGRMLTLALFQLDHTIHWPSWKRACGPGHSR